MQIYAINIHDRTQEPIYPQELYKSSSFNPPAFTHRLPSACSSPLNVLLSLPT